MIAGRRLILKNGHMAVQKATNAKSCARLLLRRIYDEVGETGKKLTPLEYSDLGSQIGLSPNEFRMALSILRGDGLIAYPNPATEMITLTRAGVERADYLRFRQELPMLGDPLPDALEGVQEELNFWVQERPKHQSRSEEWQQINARINDLRHQEGVAPNRGAHLVHPPLDPFSRTGERSNQISAEEAQKASGAGFLNLLHPTIVTSSYKQFQDGHLREAVLNSVVAVFDLIRERTGIDLDGAELVDRAFSLQHPYLVVSVLDTESGKNDQKGFIQLCKGSYQGIRSPKAHSLDHDLDEIKAAQYLVHASLLSRRVSEATLLKTEAK
jgi:uncharacterized protein (TIGR02391 family)